MFAQKTKISILGLALSFTLIGCGPAFKANKGKAGPAGILSKTGDSQANKTPQQLAEEAQARLSREEAMKKDDASIVETNDLANLYITGVKIAREGEELVFSALLKENSQDNKGSIEFRAKIPVTPNDVQAKLDAEKISLQTIKGAQTAVEPKPEEYTVTSTCKKDCSEVIVRLQRKNEALAYAAEFTFEIPEEKVADDETADKVTDEKSQAEVVGKLIASSLKEDGLVKGFNEALIDAGVEVEEAGSEVTGDQADTTVTPADAAAKPEGAKEAEGKETNAEAEAKGDEAAKQSEEANKESEKTATESDKVSEAAQAAAQKAANPKTKPSQKRLQMSRAVTVMKAQVTRLAVELRASVVDLNNKKSQMLAAKNAPRKDKKKIADLKAKTTALNKQTKVVLGLTKNLKEITAELNSLKAQLAATK